MYEYVIRAVDDLSAYGKNARTHSDIQIAQIVDSIKEFGFTNPVLIDEKGTIVAGHGRVLAARQMGMDDVPCIVLSGLTDQQRQAYVIADNQLALNAGWDIDLLKLEITELAGADFDVSLLGFDDDFVARLLNDPTQGLTDEDAIPEVEEPITQPGDLWVLGPHRLLCGDSTVATDVERVLAGVKPHLMVTDPPYGVEYDPNWRNEADRANGKKIGAMAIGVVSNDSKADWREAWALFPGEVAYVWHAGNKAHIVAESLEATEFQIRAQVIWAKNNIVIGRGHYHPKHEPCWYAVRKGGTGHWSGDRKQSTVWNIDKPMKSETGHSTQKPVECMRRPIENNSSPGQAVYEPFMGSGTTLIACESAGRICYGIELEPRYVDIAVKRWEDFTGQKAVREERPEDAQIPSDGGSVQAG